MLHNVNTPMGLADSILSAVAGDVIELAPGHYGGITIHGAPHHKVIVSDVERFGAAPVLSGRVTIRSADPSDQAEISFIEVRANNWWQFEGLDVDPGWRGESAKAVQLQGDDLAFVGSRISHGDPTGWTSQDWLERAGHGVEVLGPRGLVAFNTITTVATGVQAGKGSNGTVIEWNFVTGICRDAFRLLEDDTTLRGNYATEWRVGDPRNHWDFVQCYQHDKRKHGVLRNITIKGNHCDAMPKQAPAGEAPFVAPMGVTCSHLTTHNFTIRGNIIATEHASGILLPDARGCAVTYNTVVNTSPGAGEYGRSVIRVTGDAATRVTGNVTNWVNGQGAAHYGGNVEINGAEYADWFENWQGGDFTLADSDGPGAVLQPRNQTMPPAPVKAEPPPVDIPDGVYRQWVVTDDGAGAKVAEMWTGSGFDPLTQAEAQALADKINGGG